MNHTINRRKFIGNVGALGLAGTFPWMSPFSVAGNLKSPSNQVKVGVIGVGGRGRALLLHMQQAEGVGVAAVCDNYEPNYQRAIKLTDGKAKAYYDYRGLLENKDLDAVVIATPLHEHAHITIDCLNAGLHVFCEKAMAMTVGDCKAMVAASKENGKILQIGHQRMFDPMYHKAMEMLDAKQLGSINQIRAFWHRNNDWRRPVPSPELERKINWRLYREYSLGLMTELAPHHIQVANWVYGQAPIAVSGFGSTNHWKDGREVYDNVNLVYKYPNGKHFVYDSMISNKHYGLEVQVMGHKGTMEMETGNYYLENPPPAPGILQLINDMEKDMFRVIPIGGASWIPETANGKGGEKYYDKEKGASDGTDHQLHAFAHFIRDNNIDNKYLREGYNASMATVLGDVAMRENRVVEIPDEYRM